MTRILRALLATMLGGTLAVGPAAPTDAISGFGPIQTVVEPGCRFTTVDGDATVAPDGGTLGFVGFRGGTGTCAGGIWYVERRQGRWSSRLSPYAGQVLAVAADATGSYLLYRSSRHGWALRVGKRATAGWFAGGRRLSSDPKVHSGAIVAAGGRWWAVWSEPTETGDPSERVTDLYQAKTLGRELAKQRITRGGGTYDGDPSLLARPGGATLAWSIGDFAGDGGQLGFAEAGADGRWRLRDLDLARPGHWVFDERPDLAADGGVSRIVWEHDEVEPTGRSDPHVLTADDRCGWGPAHPFRTRGFHPRIAASGGRVIAGWTTGRQVDGIRFGEWPARVFVAELPSPGGIWTGVHISAASPHPQQLLALTSSGGKATALIGGATRVYARTQP